MEQDSIWFVFRSYCKQKRGCLLLLLLIHGVFTLVLFLYRLQLEAVLYAFALNAALLLASGTVSFLRYIHRHRQMEMARRTLLYESDVIPLPGIWRTRIFWRSSTSCGGSTPGWCRIPTRNAANGRITPYCGPIRSKPPLPPCVCCCRRKIPNAARELGAELFRIEQYVEMDLNYARLTSHSTDFVIRTCSLDDIVRQALRKYAPLFARQKLALNWEPSGRGVLTDEKWLVFVLEQLLSNALKYTPSGSISLSVEEPLTLVIEDTGIGIAAEDLPRICEKGFTGYNGRTDKKATRPWAVSVPADPVQTVPHPVHRIPAGERHTGVHRTGIQGNRAGIGELTKS